MIVLHGIWFRSLLHVWGEGSPPDGPSARSVRSERPVTERAGIASGHAASRAHPGSLMPDELHAVLGELSPDGLLASIAEETSVSLWLPSVGDDPLFSPGHARDGSVGRDDSPSHDDSVGRDDRARSAEPEAVRLRSYVVPALSLGPAEAIDLLSGLPEPLPRSCGASMTYWAQLARYVVSVLARRRFAPSVEESPDDVARAMWRVVIPEETEWRQLQAWALAMPPVCRAVVCADDNEVDPTRLVEDFLHACTDAVVRRFLAEDPFFHDIHERAKPESPWELRWLSALIGDERVIRGTTEEDTALARQVHAWIGKIDEERVGIPPRLCFELVEPAAPETGAPETVATDRAADTSNWRIRFRLQAQDGSGELQDVARVWADRSTAPTILSRHLAGRREHLANDLARAAEVFPEMEQVIKTEAPAEIALTTAETHRFLRERAPLLTARGFGVLLPAWTKRPERGLGLRLAIRPREDTAPAGGVSAGAVGLNTIVDFQWQVAIGDARVSLEEFESLRAQNEPLIRLGGQWVELDTEDARKASAFLVDHRGGRMTLLQAIRLAHGIDAIDAGLPVFGIAGTDWLEHLLNQAPAAQVDELSQPEGFCGTLRPYQLRGLSWMAFMERLGVGACLADDMGLGKTIELIALLLHERQGGEASGEAAGDASGNASGNGKTAGPTLIFAPMSVVGNWHREVEHFAPSLRVLVHHGPARLAGEAFESAAARADAVITTYALGHRDLATLQKVAWRRIVLDEAQKIKNPSAAQTIAIRSIESTHRIAMTGTPIENHLSELWSIMEMLNPGLLGSAGSFRRRFAVPIERLGDRSRAAQLRQLVQPFVLRRLKSDPTVECDLPEKMEMRVYCSLTPEQAALYERVVADLLNEVDTVTGIRRRGVILAALTKLKQVCNHPSNFLHDDGPSERRSGKCERLVEMLEEVLAEGDAALVYTQYRQMGAILERMLVERLRTELLYLHGGTTAARRQKMIDQFQTPGNTARVFILTLKAGGLGLNLTAANHVFHFDRWWNPAVENQATDRVHRIGQVRHVQVHKFVCIGTIEERIDQLLTEKLALADNIVGSGDEWLTGMSTEELRRHLMLSREAVGEV